ncbi:MAG: transcriptional regulator [Bacteroidales bacterium]|jgi:tetratricopeptide (TPR) repeat protein/DNA-binding CsgD family transcriptional regulator|nr:transcriptional regulator [Bacteroidales bacterium]
MKKLFLFLIPFFLFLIGLDANASKSSDQDEAKKLLRESMQFYQNQVYDSAISYSLIALDYFKVQNNLDEIIKTHENLGVFYADFSDFENSLWHLTEARALAEKSGSHQRLESINLNLGTTYVEAGMYDKGIKLLKKAYTYFENNETDKLDFIIAASTNIGVAYKSLGDTDSAMYYYNKAVEYGKLNKDNHQLGAPLLNIGELYYTQGNNEIALSYYSAALKIFEETNNKKGVWHSKFEIFKTQLQFEKSEMFADSLVFVANHFRKINDLNYLGKSLSALQVYYEENNKYKRALYFANELMEVKNKISQVEIINKINQMEVKIRIGQIKAENKLHIEQIRNKNRLVLFQWITITGIFLILFLIFLILFNRKKHQKQLIESHLSTSQIKQEKLKDELFFRDKELENFALHIVQKNEFLNDIKAELKKLKKNASEQNAERIKLLSLKISQSLKINKELEVFKNRIDEVNEKFFSVLSKNYPDLTENEKRLCALLKLNLSSKEIAAINEISVGAVTMARYRLRKKIGMSHKSDFADFFRKLN